MKRFLYVSVVLTVDEEITPAEVQSEVLSHLDSVDGYRVESVEVTEGTEVF